MSKQPSYCISSFYFSQEPLFQLPKMNWDEFVRKMKQLSSNQPIRFVAITSFLVFGGVPIVTFLVYAIATIIASIIGALFFELLLLAIGITGLGIVLLFVVCISGGVVSVFAALYYSYRFATCTVKRAKNPWRVSRPTDLSETQTDEPFDKNK